MTAAQKAEIEQLEAENASLNAQLDQQLAEQLVLTACIEIATRFGTREALAKILSIKDVEAED